MPKNGKTELLLPAGYGKTISCCRSLKAGWWHNCAVAKGGNACLTCLCLRVPTHWEQFWEKLAGRTWYLVNIGTCWEQELEQAPTNPACCSSCSQCSLWTARYYGVQKTLPASQPVSFSQNWFQCGRRAGLRKSWSFLLWFAQGLVMRFCKQISIFVPFELARCG